MTGWLKPGASLSLSGPSWQVGVVGKGPFIPSWVWGIPRGGVAWVLTAEAVSQTHRDLCDEVPGWFTNSELGVLVMEGKTLPPATIVVFESKGPGPSHPLWAWPDLKVVVWFDRQRRFSSPQGWHTERRRFVHKEFGGVTTSVCVASVCTRVEHPAVNWDPVVGYPSQLDQVVDPTVGTGWSVKPKSAEDLSLAGASLLDVGGTATRYVLRCVKSPTGWVRRRLTLSELAKAWDVPEPIRHVVPLDSIFSSMGDLRGAVPFKVRFYILENIFELQDGAAVCFPPAGHGVKRKVLDLASGLGGLHADGAAPTSKRFAGSEVLSSGALTFPPVVRTHETVKSDGADIPVELWDSRIRSVVQASVRTEAQFQTALQVLRIFMHKVWCRRVAHSFWQWILQARRQQLGSTKGIDVRNYRAGLAAINHALDSDWWEWRRGSAPFFWRWPVHCMEEMRDGLPPCFVGPLPKYRRPQRIPADEETVKKIQGKLVKFRDRGYIAPGAVDSLMSMFDVPKGVDDIRLVFDGTGCGLNSVLWAPWFALPNVSSVLRTLEPGYWCADNDFGEMFYNFWLHESLQSLCGMDFSKLFSNEMTVGQRVLWERWCRSPMGLKSSPYNATRGAANFKRVLLGDRTDPSNTFHWTGVCLNLPCTEEYNPGRPWIFKTNREGGVAADVAVYVDDGRSTAQSKEEAWQAGSKFAKTASFLGLQDTARKRFGPSQAPDQPWFGVKMSTLGGTVRKSIAVERWEKTKRLLREIKAELDEQGMCGWAWCKELVLNLKKLERVVGFLVYVSATYHVFTPYLKGFYLTMNSWRPDRDKEGWKIPGWEKEVVRRVDEESDTPEDVVEVGAPTLVAVVPRLPDDLKALCMLTEAELPPTPMIRPTSSAGVLVGFGDASGGGFGINVTETSREDNYVTYDYGSWNKTLDASSSNFREMLNFVNWLERSLHTGIIQRGCEIFLFTDNFVTERCFYRGTASSRVLFDLVLQLRSLELEGQIFLHIIWVAGTRMIEQGADGLSRGDFGVGVMAGASVLQFVPITKGALERSGTLRDWIGSWTRNTLVEMEPEDWFDRAHSGKENCLWAPPPPIADVALEQLCAARHIHSTCFHVIVVPNLMTARWRFTLRKVADVLITVPVGCSVWPRRMHESLTLAIVCPLLNRCPWQLRNTKLAVDLEGQLSGVWSPNCVEQGNMLREFWHRSVTLDTMSGSLARRLLQETSRGPVPRS